MGPGDGLAVPGRRRAVGAGPGEGAPRRPVVHVPVPGRRPARPLAGRSSAGGAAAGDVSARVRLCGGLHPGGGRRPASTSAAAARGLAAWRGRRWASPWPASASSRVPCTPSLCLLMPAPRSLRIAPLGDAALLVELGQRVDTALNTRALALAAALRRRRDVREAVPGYASVAVHYDPEQVTYRGLAGAITRLLTARPPPA